MIRAAFLCFMVVASFCFFQLQSIAQQKHSCDMLNESRLRINSKLCEENYKTADKNALFNIGYLFQTGLNNAKYEGDKLIKLGEKDTETAILWYQRATELGDDGSPYMIANLYLHGYDGITRNYEKSIYWFRVAVSLKNLSAANELARIYGKGFGSIPQLQNDYLQYYWVLVSDAIDKKPDYQWNKQIEARLAYKDIIEVQNKVEFCVKSNFKNCNP